MRVVSLLPAGTEICFALGVEPVGVSHECDYPETARDLPAVNRSRIDETADSATINEQVAAAQAGEGVYAVDREKLASLEPDLVITQGVCEVCAVDRVLVEDAVAELGLDATVLTLDVHTVEGLFDAIGAIAAAVGAEERGRALVEELRAGLAAVRERVPEDRPTPTVAVLDWLDPIMVAGHWMPELVEVAGGAYGMADAGAHSRPREFAALREYDPDAIVLSPCGFELEQIRANVGDLREREGWDELAATRAGEVYLLDGHHYVNRPGPRLVDTCEILAGLLWSGIDLPVADAVARLSPPTA